MHVQSVVILLGFSHNNMKEEQLVGTSMSVSKATQTLSLNSITRSLMQLTIALQMTLLGILYIEMHWWLSQTFLVPLLCNRTTSDFFQSLGMTSSLQTWSARCCKRCTNVNTKPKDASVVNWETATLISSSVSGGVLSSSPASICKHTTLLKQVLSVLVHLSAPYTSVF